MLSTLPQTQSVKLFPKEALPTMQFTHLHKGKLPASISADLEEAVILGNGYRGKVTLVFQTKDGDVAVQTTIWQADSQCVTLKGGLTIPTSCIKEVRFYSTSD